ncbi:hypothetical protein HY621_04155 [Candidatus Uhrbacteria bacterium]|nr:hypothetical protein [Candidatus Uhrbacteria bacterium]
MRFFILPCIATIFLFSLLVPFNAHAIGLAPATLTVERLPKDFQYTGEVFISRGNPAQDTPVEISISGVAADYISLPRGMSLILPKGEKQVAIAVVISTKGLASGTYEAEIKVVEKPAEVNIQEGSSGSTLATGVLGAIRFEVVDEAIEDYKVGGLKVTGTEEQEIIGFSYQLSNKGNVSARPTKIDFTVVDDSDKRIVYTETISAVTLKPVSPLSDNWVEVMTGAHLGVGRYNATADFYKSEEKFATYTYPFQVFPRGTLAQKGELLSVASDKYAYDQGESVKFSGVFQNQGTIGLVPQFFVEIFLDGKRIETLTAEAGFLPPGRDAEVAQFFSTKKGGSYRALAYVSYGPFKSKEFEISFTVKDSFFLVLIAIGVLTFSLAFIFFIVYNKRRKRKLNLLNK